MHIINLQAMHQQQVRDFPLQQIPCSLIFEAASQVLFISFVRLPVGFYRPHVRLRMCLSFLKHQASRRFFAEMSFIHNCLLSIYLELESRTEIWEGKSKINIQSHEQLTVQEREINLCHSCCCNQWWASSL